MGKRITKIICAAVAVLSAAALAVAPACGSGWKGVSATDGATKAVDGTNGGFVVETEDYVYFVNGKTSNTDPNKFGKVLKGSVQRISKTDLDAANYANTETVVPSVYYSGSYNAGLYIYDGYLYYTSPTTEKDVDGKVLNSNLDFKRTKLDGTDTSATYIWQCADNSVDYRYVTVGGQVYILYALSENLYGTSATNIHSVNCTTGVNTILAYNVSDYLFDTVDVENPYVYYTMNVPLYFGSTTNYDYNQMYRVRADATESPRTLNFDDVEDYDADKDPVYINLGDYVFDGIGKTNYESGRVTQLNFAHYNDKQYNLVNDDYSYDLQWYRDGELFYTRKSKGNSSLTNLYSLTGDKLDADADGKVDASWDAVEANKSQKPLILGADTTEYRFVTMDGKLYGINAAASGITKSEITADGKVESALTVAEAESATILAIREEGGHVNVYYSVTGGNGYTVNRIAIDGSDEDYRKLPTQIEPDLTYRSVKILDLDASSSWFMPEFVGNKLLFASETEGMTSYEYIMVCDLNGANGIMDNSEIDALNKKYEAVTEKIEKYDEQEKEDGTKYYDGLANALKYLRLTGDTDYVAELNKAFVDIEGKDEYYAYSEASVGICNDFVNSEGDWAEYADDFKTINGKKVYASSRDYYYTVLGRMTVEDADGLVDGYRTSCMKEYPVDNSTWWQKLSTGAKAGFIIGMVACGLAVIGGATVLTIYLVRRKRNKGGESSARRDIDITDDRNMDVYGDGEGGEE